MQQLLNIARIADTGGVGENLIVRAVAGGKAAVATGSTAALIGVSLYDTPAGQPATIQVDGVARVKLGGTVNADDPITSNASGQGVAAAPAAGVNAWIVGIALESGVAGDLIDVQIAPSRIQG
jgi:hypothetical protein